MTEPAPTRRELHIERVFDAPRDLLFQCLTDPAHRQVLGEWAKKKLGCPVLRSLAPSEIGWDSRKEDAPRTWPNWEQDLKNAGLTQVECNRVLALVFEANALDDAKLQKAREVFLRGQEPMPEEFSSPRTEQPSTPSGGPAKG